MVQQYGVSEEIEGKSTKGGKAQTQRAVSAWSRVMKSGE